MAGLCALAAACASPASSKVSYAGQWTGSTAQGEPISFTISSDELVTAISVGYSFNGCRGSQTFTNLSISIAPQVTCIPGPCSPSITSYRAFGYENGDFIQGPSTEVHGGFPVVTSATGTVNFRNYAGCGSAIGVAWSATRK